MGEKALLKLYSNCEKIDFDDNKKIVIISDIHRGDGTYADSFINNRNIYFATLSYYYNDNYTLVEAGDGDELWKNKNFSDIACNYRGIFKLLKKFNDEGRLCMLYGNHDSKKVSKEYINKQISMVSCINDKRSEEFISFVKNVDFKEGIILKYTPMNKEIFVTHGHQLDFINYNLCGLSKFLVRYVWRFLEGIAGFKAPTSPANSYKKGSSVDNKLEKWSEKYKKMLICGHTHKSRFPKEGEGLYFNDGCCVFPYSITTLEIEYGFIRLVKWATYVDDNFRLYIDRSIIGGPERLENYLKYTV